MAFLPEDIIPSGWNPVVDPNQILQDQDPETPGIPIWALTCRVLKDARNGGMLPAYVLAGGGDILPAGLMITVCHRVDVSMSPVVVAAASLFHACAPAYLVCCHECRISPEQNALACLWIAPDSREPDVLWVLPYLAGGPGIAPRWLAPFEGEPHSGGKVQESYGAIRRRLAALPHPEVVKRINEIGRSGVAESWLSAAVDALRLLDYKPQFLAIGSRDTGSTSASR